MRVAETRAVNKVQNGCLSCPHLGLCLNNQPLVDTNLERKAGASDLDWLDELVD